MNDQPSGSAPPEPPGRAARSLRVLSLDGGGVKGYSSLLILKRILRTMAAEKGLETEPLPCDIFDLIVGTSTGGLIAIMLGRLHMSVDECIEQYGEASQAIFGNPIAQSRVGKLFLKATTGAFYDVRKLESAVHRILEKKDRSPQERLREDNPKCKV